MTDRDRSRPTRPDPTRPDRPWTQMGAVLALESHTAPESIHTAVSTGPVDGIRSRPASVIAPTVRGM